MKSLCAIELDYPTGHFMENATKTTYFYFPGKKLHLNDLIMEEALLLEWSSDPRLQSDRHARSVDSSGVSLTGIFLPAPSTRNTESAQWVCSVNERLIICQNQVHVSGAPPYG